MARPDDKQEDRVIPKWADDIAASIIESFGPDPALIGGAIAAALVKERERAASYHDNWVERHVLLARQRPQHADFHYEHSLRHRVAAKAIRGGHQ